MRSKCVLVMLLAGCGDDGGSFPDSNIPSSCQVDADCVTQFCNANKCGARPEWNAPQKLGGGIPLDSANQAGIAMRGDNLEIIFGTSRNATCSDLWHAERASASATFDAPSVLAAVNDASKCNGAPVVRADGLELYFGRTGSTGLGMIWRATRSSTAVDFDAPVQTSIFATNSFIPTMTMSGDGLTLLYLSAAAPGPTASVYSSTRAATSDVFAAGTEIAALAGTASSAIALAPDGRYLVAADEGGSRLNVRIRSSAGTFSNPLVLSELEDPNPVVTPTISPDGTTIYFAKRNALNNNEIWYATRK